jgi:hypothetical protein
MDEGESLRENASSSTKDATIAGQSTDLTSWCHGGRAAQMLVCIPNQEAADDRSGVRSGYQPPFRWLHQTGPR